jgi:hypothetical protein
MSNSISSLSNTDIALSNRDPTTVARPPVTTAQPQDAETASVINAISINAVPFDMASFTAIMASIKAAGGSAASGPGQAAALQNVMTMIGKTLSQGQGAYYIAIDAPGGALLTAMTPDQLQAYMQSGGSLDQDNLVSSDGHTYSLHDLLQQAFAASARTERLQAANPAMDDPKLKMAEALLDQMRADTEPSGSMRSLLFGSKSANQDKVRQIRTVVLQMNPDATTKGISLTIVYFPPGASNLPDQTASPDAPTALQLPS